MSRYEEMEEAVNSVRRKWTSNQQASYKAAGIIVKGFEQYCEFPQGHIFLMPLDKKPKDGSKYNVIGAMHYGEDGFWHLGLGMNISAQRWVLNLGITERNGKTVVKLLADGQPREVDLTNEAGRNDLYDFMARGIVKWFDSSALDELDGATTKQIGFHG
jgi:hypothetical protein